VVKIEHEHSEHHKKPDTQQQIATWGTVISVVLLLVISFQLSALNKALTGGSLGAAVAPSQPTAAAPSAAAPSVPLDMKALSDDDPFLGKADAPVTIVEWSDYECPFCQRFHSETFGQIVTNYVNTGKVKFVYRDFPLSFHPQAQKAAEAAACAGKQGKYFEMHDLLFSKGVQGSVAGFKQYAKDLGLNSAQFDSCLDSGETASEIAKDEQDGVSAGIQGTPGFIVDGRLISGAQPYTVFQQAIDAALAAQ